jgi:glutathione S-transferase
MITLFNFGPALGLPDPSPFVMKTEILLKMAGLHYQTKSKGLSRAPKGKIPYIIDDGQKIGDSTFIRWHIEKKYNIDLDHALSDEQRAIAWAFEKMAEDNLYWAVLETRWMNKANFRKGPAQFFRRVPGLIRPFVKMMVRGKIRKALKAHGMGRHNTDEIGALAVRSVDAIAAYLGHKPFFMGAEPSGIDATMYAFIACVLCPVFDCPERQAAERHDNLRRYLERMSRRFYPELAKLTASKAVA